MKKLLFVISLAVLFCFASACQNKAEKAELEKFRAQAKGEEQNGSSHALLWSSGKWRFRGGKGNLFSRLYFAPYNRTRLVPRENDRDC